MTPKCQQLPRDDHGLRWQPSADQRGDRLPPPPPATRCAPSTARIPPSHFENRVLEQYQRCATMHTPAAGARTKRVEQGSRTGAMAGKIGAGRGLSWGCGVSSRAYQSRHKLGERGSRGEFKRRQCVASHRIDEGCSRVHASELVQAGGEEALGGSNVDLHLAAGRHARLKSGKRLGSVADLADERQAGHLQVCVCVGGGGGGGQGAGVAAVLCGGTAQDDAEVCLHAGPTLL